MKRIHAVGLLLALGLQVSCLPAMAQYGSGGMGGGLGPIDSAPPPPAPAGSIGNPPPPGKPVKYFDGCIRDITGNVVTVDQQVVVPGESAPLVVSKKFVVQDSTLYDPSDWKFALKDRVRVIYEPRSDKLVITKVIKDRQAASN